MMQSLLKKKKKKKASSLVDTFFPRFRKFEMEKAKVSANNRSTTDQNQKD